MDIEKYFKSLSDKFYVAYGLAQEARKKGFDPEDAVEILPAPDLASRVEGLTGVKGISELIRSKTGTPGGRSGLAFEVAREICTSSTFSQYDPVKKAETAVRVGTAILTEGVLVAPTEGIRGIDKYRNQDGTEYLAIVFAGPIRGAGGTAAALSVALADYARKLLNFQPYKPTQEEIERCVEEIELYHTRAARLQYRGTDDDVRVIVGNCPVCIDGVPTEEIEVGVHGNLSRIDGTGKTVPITNKVRGGVALVVCEGIAQKAKKMLKETKAAGLDWNWLNNVIKADMKKKGEGKGENTAVFLEELVAGRPVLAYPGSMGGFRLRYGRGRFTGIASKGFNPATMIILDSFIAVGTQLKVEFPGKGCVAVPVDSIEGPCVKLRSGEVLRINDADTAKKLKQEVETVLSLGDMLVTYGDFRKSNTKLQPTSYVEEFWEAQLRDKGYADAIDHRFLGFNEAYSLSLNNQVPLHPKFLYEFQSVKVSEVEELADEIRNLKLSGTLQELGAIMLENRKTIKHTLELLNVPHKLAEGTIVIESEYARSLVASLGFAEGEAGILVDREIRTETEDTLQHVNAVAPFRIMKRSTFVGARIGRPEKARERLMKPAPHVLFPIGSYESKDRNISKAYSIDSKRFRSGLSVELALYVCPKCKRTLDTNYCYDCDTSARIVRKCRSCGSLSMQNECPKCGSPTLSYEYRNIDLARVVTNAMGKIKVGKLPNTIKGVKGLTNADRSAEHLEKGILRALNNIYIFKDGTSRFDATDVPITHFYPKEIGVGVAKLRELGYDRDYLGNELVSDEQLVELRHQDVILNRRGADYLLHVSHFVDDLLERLYGLERFYNAMSMSDMVGELVITLSPHTSCGVLNRIIGFCDANVGLAHPYTITARRRNCDGDEDTTMLLLDALINFSRKFLPTTIGGSMDTPLILTLNVMPEEVDDEVHAMEVTEAYGLDFYEKTLANASPAEVTVSLVEGRLNTSAVFQDLKFTHGTSARALPDSPRKSVYTELKTMQEKVEAEFALMDRLLAVNNRDAARRVITSHFIPDLIGNLHSFSRQIFRCSSCNAKYRRVPLQGKCVKDGGKLLLTISKGGIEKYLDMAIGIADRYQLDPYIRQRLALVKEEIGGFFDVADPMKNNTGKGQLSLGFYL